MVQWLVLVLRALGYAYGHDYVTEPRGAEAMLERFPSLAAEPVSLKVDVIVAVGNSQQAVKEATSTIPVVMAGSGEPRLSGRGGRLSRPRANITSLTLLWVDPPWKRPEPLKQNLPTPAPAEGVR